MKKLTPVKAIRTKCLDCSGGSAKEVRECHISDCELWLYRMGRRPREEDLVRNREVAKGLLDLKAS